MSDEPANPTWREKLTVAAVQAAISGAVRAIITWMLELAASSALLARLLPGDDPSDDARPMVLANQAAVWLQELACERPDLHLADLAGVLMLRASLKARVGDDRGSAADADLALRYHRALASNVAAHRPMLAEALLARLDLPADQRLDRRALLREAVGVYEALGQDAPERYLPDLARVHLQLATELQPSERKATPESLMHRRQGVDILADLAERGRPELGLEAVRELLNHAALLTKAGRGLEAQGIRGRASQINILLGDHGVSASDPPKRSPATALPSSPVARKPNDSSTPKPDEVRARLASLASGIAAGRGN